MHYAIGLLQISAKQTMAFLCRFEVETHIVTLRIVRRTAYK